MSVSGSKLIVSFTPWMHPVGYPAKLFGGYETVYVVGDNDVKEDGSNPGAEFSKRVANEVMNSTIVTLPPNMDINDYYLAHGASATRKLLIGESGE